MFDEIENSVHRCARCNKPFDKLSTLKRHGYYCRSQDRTSVPRARSCLTCAKLKTRCDNTEPACSTCVTKGSSCRYPPKRRKCAVATLDHADSDTIEGRDHADPLSEQALEDQSPTVNFLSVGLDLTFPKVNEPLIIADLPYIDFTSSADAFAANTIDQSLTFQGNMPWQVPVLHPQPTTITRQLVPRGKGRPSAQSTTSLVIQVLKSYLSMLKSADALPPFIHRTSMPQSMNDSVETETFANCISLVRMTDHSGQGNVKLFWKNVKMECERMLAEHNQMNKRQLLAAMQALSVYLLIRVNEGETESNNCDSILIAAVTVIAQQLNASTVAAGAQDPSYTQNLETQWQDWVFEESTRRLCVIYQVVNMLFYFEPAAMCDHPSGLVLAPLPAKKQLWEAADAWSWIMQMQKEPRSQISFGLAADGDLMKLTSHPGVMVSLHRSMDILYPMMEIADWEEWCAGMDDFGALILLAASLIG